ncbi:hypothetical protein [Pelagibius sp. Alg239-R121]|uniref:hypothetical protein n=1 Tax=Pelagibius sp. Alg239-R121 TaxID=2993448 RepID=UPI0024A6A4D9|nr:hypothetical protein [Pelagibius sp. Alg239-R121]
MALTWKRLEGSAVDPEMTEGISARVADPLWLLARQWQVGEFRGEDAASPVLMTGTIVSTPVSEYRVGDRPPHIVPRQDAGIPLETLAEHESVADGPAAPAIRLESGAALLRALSLARLPKGFLQTLRDAYAFTDPLEDPLDPVGVARLRLLARRSIDGAHVVTAIEDAGDDPAALPEVAALRQRTAKRAATTIRAWLDQEAAIFRAPAPDLPSAWSPRRLEYSFGLGAEFLNGKVELRAPEYPGGRLEWYHFDVDAMSSRPGGLEQVPGLQLKKLDSLPTPLQLAGMPAARWWEFEDGDVDFGDLASGPEDLARSVIAAYAMVASDDWFMLPCTLPSGSLSRVVSLKVLDDFGTWTKIESTAVNDGTVRPWRWFELQGDVGPERGLAPVLFLPPVVNAVEQGRPLESVEFRRDEMANMGWAIEHRVESGAGRPVDREAGNRPDTDAHDSDETWQYRLSTDVWDNWVPLVPVRITADSPQIVLRRGTIALGKPSDAHQAKGRILEPETIFVLNEEEIPAGGLRVTRRYQLARSADGGVHLWVGRRKRPSGGPMRRTPLRFDSLTGWRQPKALTPKSIE